MELEHSFTIPVSPEQAWQVLLDVEQIAPCMPGATVDSVDDDVISGRIKVKVGPVALTYAGTARFIERDEKGRTVTLEASGKETRGSGTASATVHSSLQDESGQTRVVVHTTLSVTGRPAQFGRGVMAEVGGKIIERFATNLASQLAGTQPAGASPAGGPPAGDAPSANGAGPGTTAPGPAAQASATPVEELNLPVRVYNALRREGIHTLGDLSARSEGELLAIENLGPQSVKEIKHRLADRGFSLALGAESVPGHGESASSARTGDVGGTDSGGTHTAVSEAGAAAGNAGVAADGVAADGVAAGADLGAGASAGGTAAARDSAATGYPAPQTARPPDEDALDLLSVAGFPVLKRALPAAGVLVVLLMAFLRLRRGRRRANP
jgi:carbon monoxide dehydrogenase subunit G